ncbi:MAG: 30S ribosomal protein S27ae [Candidatus Micrarchaeota archaeon]
MAEKKERKTKKFEKKQNCPKCGPGTNLGKHNNRVSCGKCGYTEMKKS